MCCLCSRNRRSLEKIEEDLKESVRLRVSTAEKFENTAENPEIILESSWDMSQADLTKQGVCKLIGYICGAGRISVS